MDRPEVLEGLLAGVERQASARLEGDLAETQASYLSERDWAQLIGAIRTKNETGWTGTQGERLWVGVRALRREVVL